MEPDADDDQHDHGRGDDPVHDEAERRPPSSVGDVVAAVLPEILEPVAEEADHQQPRRPGDTRRGEHDEDSGNDALDDDDGRPSVGHGETDVDRRDQGQPERVDGRRVEPPERHRRGGLQGADHDAPQHGLAQQSRHLPGSWLCRCHGRFLRSAPPRSWGPIGPAGPGHPPYGPSKTTNRPPQQGSAQRNPTPVPRVRSPRTASRRPDGDRRRCRRGRYNPVSATPPPCRTPSGSPGTGTKPLTRDTRTAGRDRKSTRLNSSHMSISYAVFCLKKKKKNETKTESINTKDAARRRTPSCSLHHTRSTASHPLKRSAVPSVTARVHSVQCPALLVA